MILYKKASFKKSVTQKTYRLMKVGTQDTGEGENFLGFSRPRLCVNLRPDDGALVNTRGFKAFDLGGGIVEYVHKFENRLLRIFQHNERSAQGSISAQIVVTDENHDVYVVQPGVFGEPVLWAIRAAR